MTSNTWTPQEIEQDRQEAVEEYIANQFDEEDQTAETIARNSQPGTYDCHEVLDKSSELLDSVARHLMQHPSIISNPKWFTLAHNAHTMLFNLYQDIGAEHLELIPDNLIELIEAKKAQLAVNK
jgi:Zn-dependent oligopeptidase